MIVDKIEAHLATGDLSLDEGMLKAVADQVVASTKRQFMEVKAQTVGVIRPSAIGRCARQGWYQFQGMAPDEPLPGRTRFVFWYGDLIETAMLGLARLAGCNLSMLQAEVPVVLNGQTITGHVDAVLTEGDERLVVECKSMSSIGFKRTVESGISNDFGYLDQIQAYMRALDVKRGLFILANKEQGHLHEQIVVRDDSAYLPKAEAYHRGVTGKEPPPRPYDTELEIVSAKGRAAADAMLQSNDRAMIVGQGGAYFKVQTGRRTLKTVCGYCGFKQRCFPNLKVEMDGDRPKFVIEGGA